MKRLITYTSLLVLVVCMASGASKDSEKDLNSQLRALQGIFQQNLEMIEFDFMDSVDKCANAYAAAMAKAEDEATKQGNLDAVVEIRKERKRFLKDRAVEDVIPANANKMIKDAINVYLESLKNAGSVRSAKAAHLARKYINHLQGMQKKLTTEKKIDQALLVKAELERTRKNPVIIDALKFEVDVPARGSKVCTECKGSRYISKVCPDCNGSGTCSYCGGSGVRTGLGGKGIKCFACTGSKKCGKCKGTGKIRELCPECSGTGLAN